MKGGVAKTTLAVNLADCLNRRHSKSILIVDIDPQFNATQCLVSGEEYIARLQRSESTIVDIFDDIPRPLTHPVKGLSRTQPKAFDAIRPWKVSEGMELLAGNLELHRLEMPAGQGREFRLKKYIETVGETENYDFVIIDTPPTPSAWMTSALLASDHYIIPVKPEPLSTTGIDLLKGVVDRISGNFGNNTTCLGIALTIAEKNTVVFKQTKAYLDSNEVWKGKRYNHFLPKRTEIAREQGNQHLILDLTDSEAKRQLSGIAQEFLNRIT